MWLLDLSLKSFVQFGRCVIKVLKKYKAAHMVVDMGLVNCHFLIISVPNLSIKFASAQSSHCGPGILSRLWSFSVSLSLEIQRIIFSIFW